MGQAWGQTTRRLVTRQPCVRAIQVLSSPKSHLVGTNAGLWTRPRGEGWDREEGPAGGGEGLLGPSAGPTLLSPPGGYAELADGANTRLAS